MGRAPCCSKVGLNRGTWTALEDRILTAYIKAHGVGNWRNLPKRAGLKRCGKSCRLRWLNYLKPDIKRGNISRDEEELIIRLHNLLGNRWSLIAGRIPGRTDNEIKNYWNSTLSKKAKIVQLSNNDLSTPPPKSSKMRRPTDPPHVPPRPIPQLIRPRVVRAKPVRCTTTTQVLHDPAGDSNSRESPAVSVLLPQFDDTHLHDMDGNGLQSSRLLVEFEQEFQNSCYVPYVDDIPNSCLGDAILQNEYGHVNHHQRNGMTSPTEVGILDYWSRPSYDYDFSMGKDIFDIESLAFVLDSNF